MWDSLKEYSKNASKSVRSFYSVFYFSCVLVAPYRKLSFNACASIELVDGKAIHDLLTVTATVLTLIVFGTAPKMETMPTKCAPLYGYHMRFAKFHSVSSIPINFSISTLYKEECMHMPVFSPENYSMGNTSERVSAIKITSLCTWTMCS